MSEYFDAKEDHSQACLLAATPAKSLDEEKGIEMTLTYEAWRISFQSSEQAARSAYDQLAAARARIDAVGEAALNRQAKFQQREAELLADNARLREELNTVYKLYPDLVAIMTPSALAATPAQSLARHNNAIREECATAGGPEDSYQDEWFKAKADSAARIRAMKEPE